MISGRKQQKTKKGKGMNKIKKIQAARKAGGRGKAVAAYRASARLSYRLSV